MFRPSRGTATLAAIVREIRRNQIPFLAAAIAFYGFVSIVPLLLLALAVGGVLGLPIGQASLALSGELLTEAGQQAVIDAVSNQQGSGGAGLIGLLFLTWSGLKVFRGLDTAFSLVYDTPGRESFVAQLRDGLLVLVTIPVVIVAAAVLGVVVPSLVQIPFLGVLSPLLLVITLSVAFLPMYYRFPDTPVTLREVVPGTVVAALGWTVLGTGFGIYARYVGSFALYGILGAGLLLVTWMYLGGIIIMVGAVVNAVLAGRTADDTERTDSVDSDGQAAATDIEEVARDVSELRAELEEKTVHRSEIQDELQRYVRRRMRRGKARGWGPYVVLLYGTVMTLGAFYWLSGGWAILAMLVVWLSTLGLYVLMVLFGVGIGAVGVPGRVLDRLRERRS